MLQANHIENTLRSLAYKALDARTISKARKQGLDAHRIVIVCRRGHGFADNPAYIVHALERLFPHTYDFVLLAFEKPANLPPYVRYVAADTRNAIYELARARLWIANVRTNWPIDKMPGQLYLQTWHASMGPKLSEKCVENKFPSGYVPMAKRDGSFTDFMFANDKIHLESFAHDYWQTGPVLHCGIPRNRPLIHFDSVKAQKTRVALGVPADHGLLLYAPTFRNAKDLKKHVLNLDTCAKTLQRRFKCPFSVAYRLHAEIAQTSTAPFLDGFINASNLDDPQELLCASDVLISDYSSILEDFLMLGRPCFTFAPDLEEYEQERGFYYPLQTRPAPFAQTEDQLITNILQYDHITFLKQRIAFFKKHDVCENGCGDEVIAQVIHNAMPLETPIQSAITKCQQNHLFDTVEQVRGIAPAAKAPCAPLTL